MPSRSTNPVSNVNIPGTVSTVQTVAARRRAARRRAARRTSSMATRPGAATGVGGASMSSSSMSNLFANLTGNDLKIAQAYYWLGHRHEAEIHGLTAPMFGK
jgi:hypothetical protein